MLRRFAVSVTTLAVALALAAPAAAQSNQDPVNTLQLFAQSVNRNDPAAVQANFFTDDAVVVGGPCGNTPEGACIGKPAILNSIQTGGAVNVSVEVLSVSDNVLRIRVQERFDLPQEAIAAGVQRYVETGTAVINGSKIARLGLMPDLLDQQTVTAMRVFATLGAQQQSAMPAALVANDGQSLATQPTAVQSTFIGAYGSQAATEWVKQHNAALSH